MARRKQLPLTRKQQLVQLIKSKLTRRNAVVSLGVLGLVITSSLVVGNSLRRSYIKGCADASGIIIGSIFGVSPDRAGLEQQCERIRQGK